MATQTNPKLKYTISDSISNANPEAAKLQKVLHFNSQNGYAFLLYGGITQHETTLQVAYIGLHAVKEVLNSAFYENPADGIKTAMQLANSQIAEHYAQEKTNTGEAKLTLSILLIRDAQACFGYTGNHCILQYSDNQLINLTTQTNTDFFGDAELQIEAGISPVRVTHNNVFVLSNNQFTDELCDELKNSIESEEQPLEDVARHYAEKQSVSENDTSHAVKIIRIEGEKKQESKTITPQSDTDTYDEEEQAKPLVARIGLFLRREVRFFIILIAGIALIITCNALRGKLFKNIPEPITDKEIENKRKEIITLASIKPVDLTKQDENVSEDEIDSTLSNQTFIIYTTQKGETTHSIAKRFSLKTLDITRNNWLKPKLEKGTKLKIPVKAVHEVKKDETLEKIAQKYECSAESIKKANNCEEHDVKPSMKLYIPLM